MYFHDIPCFINIQNLYPDYFVLWLFFLKAIIFGLKIKCDYPISKLNVAFNRIKHLSWYYYFDREWNSLQGCDLDLFPLKLFLHCSSFIDSCKVYLMMILKYMIMVKISACIGSKNNGGSVVITLLLSTIWNQYKIQYRAFVPWIIISRFLNMKCSLQGTFNIDRQITAINKKELQKIAESTNIQTKLMTFTCSRPYFSKAIV